MEYRDINNNPIKPGFYVETFVKEEDGFSRFNNRIVCIRRFGEDLYSIVNQTKPTKLNPNYSQWLKPFEDEIPPLEAKSKS